MENEFKKRIKSQLIIASRAYFKLINKVIILKSENFINKKMYYLAFDKTNFLHLTGVITSLSPKIFFEKCFKGIIESDDFSYNKFRNKGTIKSKMKNIIFIDKLFDNTVYVQEDFVKNRISCKLATSNKKYTLGFTGGKWRLYPNTLLDNDHLDKNRLIVEVKPTVELIKIN